MVEIGDPAHRGAGWKATQRFWRRLETILGVAVATTVTAFLALIEVLTTLSDQPRGLQLLVAAGFGAVVSAAAVAATQTGHRLSAGIAALVVVALLAFWASRADGGVADWTTVDSTLSTLSTTSSTPPRPASGSSPGQAPDDLRLRWFTHATPLFRSQARDPASGNRMATSQVRPGAWDVTSTVALVYPADEQQIPGLVPVFRLRCASACGERPLFDFTSAGTRRPDWEWDGTAFKCFDPAVAPAGTRPLRLLENEEGVRMWAVPGTADHARARADDFREPEGGGSTLCYVWPTGVTP